MSEERFNDLVKKRTEAGLYYKDEDWPDDPEDRSVPVSSNPTINPSSSVWYVCVVFIQPIHHEYAPHLSNSPAGSVVLHAPGEDCPTR